MLIEQQAVDEKNILLTASNASRFPVMLEVPIGAAAGQSILAEGAALPMIDGVAMNANRPI